MILRKRLIRLSIDDLKAFDILFLEDNIIIFDKKIISKA